MVQFQKNISKNFILTSASIFCVVGCFLIFILRAYNGLNILEFSDETEKFVAAKLINEGMKLYKDIFAHHGPVPYIIAHAYSNVISQTDFTLIRLVMIFFALFSSVCIYFSPVLKSAAVRSLVTASYLFMLSSIWILHKLNVVHYSGIGGFLLVVPAMQLILPLFLGVSPRKNGAFFSGVAMAVLWFLGYCYWPSAVFFVLAFFILLHLNKSNLNLKGIVVSFWIGVLSAFLLILLWMVLYADPKGFIIYHIYFNQAVYAKFIKFNPLSDLLKFFKISFEDYALIHTATLIGFFSCFIFFVVKSYNKKFFYFAAVFLFFLAIVSVNPRGGFDFHDSPFEILAISLFSLMCGVYVQENMERRHVSKKHVVKCFLLFLIPVVVFECISSNAVLASYNRLSRDELQKKSPTLLKESDKSLYKFVRSFVAKDEHVQALVFEPSFYIYSNRRPASGQYYYLPWQAEYNKHPVPGYCIDICQDIKNNQPPLVFFDHWTVWGSYSLDTYEPCVKRILDSSYLPLNQTSTLYVRQRMVTVGTQKRLSSGVVYRFKESAPLSKAKSIRVLLPREIVEQKQPVRKVGIQFAAHKKIHHGEAEIRITSPAGSLYAQKFSLEQITDDEYLFFAIDTMAIDSIEILSTSGEGISTWESSAAGGEFLTCALYQYANKKWVIAPGFDF